MAAHRRVSLVVLAMSASIVAQSAVERQGRYVSFVACPEFRMPGAEGTALETGVSSAGRPP